MVKTEKVGAVVTPDIKAQIRQVMARDDRSEGDIVRLALAAYLERELGEATA